MAPLTPASIRTIESSPHGDLAASEESEGLSLALTAAKFGTGTGMLHRIFATAFLPVHVREFLGQLREVKSS